MGNNSVKIRCSDNIFRSEDEIKEIVKEFETYRFFYYRGVKYAIYFNKTHLNGYVNLEENKLKYDGHFGITGSFTNDLGEYYIGFDCAHYEDIELDNKNPPFENATFKLPEFIHEECQRMIDSYYFKFIY